MIILVCGPSGAGKTTLIKELIRSPTNKLINITIFRLFPRHEVEIGKTVVSREEYIHLKPLYRFTYEYNDTLYGFNITPREIRSKDVFFIDYPGEYPFCTELAGIDWSGILVMPPNKRVLLKRIAHAGREYRSESAVNEYEECLSEIKKGLYYRPLWEIYISKDKERLLEFVQDYSKRIISLLREEGK